MALDELAPPAREPMDSDVESQPTVIEVRDLVKEFAIPLERTDSVKERVLHPFARPRTRQLTALNRISFDVRRGEFFGIVGRNGTGKSTLLKILASIYGSDAGSIRIAGRLAPFIELGVGFNQELTARENVILNGVMMGLKRNVTEDRVDAVIEFAELQEFADLKLKNYSSGMLVRLAFSVMLQSDADILLVDEVLAVGDASFQQKCEDVFHDIRGSGRTVVLVTHDMSAVEQFCDRAMLLEGGDIVIIGEPHEVAHRYLRLNYADPRSTPASDAQAADPNPDLLLVDAWLESDGARRTNLEQGVGAEFHAVFEARADIPWLTFGFVLRNIDGVEIGGFGADPSGGERERGLTARGTSVRVRATLANHLAPGRYALECWAYCGYWGPPPPNSPPASYAEPLMMALRILDFVVFGTEATVGLVSIAEEVDVVLGTP